MAKGEIEFDGEVTLLNVLTAIRPTGDKGYRLDFTFPTPIALNKENKERTITIDINPGAPITPPTEMRAIIYLFEEEWDTLSKKFQVGKKYLLKIKDDKIIIE